jgi:hypothetical protein
MRFLSYASAALLAAASAFARHVPSFDFRPTPRDNTRHVPAKQRHKSGHLYPHSSKRQQARYARQIAANQLNMAGCRKGGAA